MIDEQSSASGHDYASDRSAIGESREKPGSGVRIVSGKAWQCIYVSGIARQGPRRVIIPAEV